jgi:hypothetical protein
MPLEPGGPQLFSPKELAQNEIRKRAMVDLFLSEEAVLVIGAGCSVRLKYPTWEALLSKLAALAVEIADDHHVKFDLNETLAREAPLRCAGEIKAFINHCDGSLNRY